MPRVFLSYARADGELPAAQLCDRVAREASDIVIRQDRLFLEGGIGWWKQVTEAIDSVDFLILVMTPAALASGNVQKEWRYARQQGVCVYPIKGTAHLAFSQMPRWMSKAHFFDLDAEWPTFLAHLRKGCDTPRVPFMAPDLPPHFVQRPSEYDALKNLLLSADRGQPVAIATALTGAGGFGKTTLATALCHDDDILANFDDGILWVTLGQTPNILGALLTAYAALTGARPGFAGVDDAAFQLAQKLEQRTCLLVIDDVWDAAHLHPFLRAAKSCARLFTTRDAALAAEATPVNVDEMRKEEAAAMLAQSVPGLDLGTAGVLAGRLGEWPLALELAGAMMRERVRQGDTVGHAATRLMTIIQRKGFGALQDPTAADQRHRTVSSVLKVSLELLDAAGRRRLSELSIFPEDVGIPLAAAASAWELDELDAEGLAQLLARLSLIKLDLDRGVLRLHDVMRSWLAAGLTDARTIHNRLVDAWADWKNLPDLPDAYAWRWLTWHLVQADRKPDAQRILSDPAWMQAKLKAAGVIALIADYQHGKASPDLKLIQGALLLSANALAADPSQFAGQMVGRLLPHRASPAIQHFMDEVAKSAPSRWLRPLHPALLPPGAELVLTLVGHTAVVSGVAVTPDGKQAVSGAYDTTVKVWDLETGRALRTLKGHSQAVNSVALTPCGKRVISASVDDTLKVWDLKTGQALLTLQGHSSDVNGVAVTGDGKLAVSASNDRTLKVWDLETGRALRTLEGHSDWVEGVAVTADGKRAVSASRDNTLRLWELETGHTLCSLKGHSGAVFGVAVTADGKRAISASSDQTLMVWDLETGLDLLTLKGHSSAVMAVAVTGDATRAVSASTDGTLKLWDLETGRAVLTLEGHDAFVYGVALTPDGGLAISAPWDHTLKVWDLTSGRGVPVLEGHSYSVGGLSVTEDRRRVVSASSDQTLKVWDLETGRVLLTLEGHSSLLNDVSVNGDGRRAVSASTDNRVKLWDLETCREICALEGHDNFVESVAMTADGKRAVSASWDMTLKVWDLDTHQCVHTLKGHSASVWDVALTSDGNRAVSASADSTLKVWDLETGRELRTLQDHSDAVFGVAVTRDGKRAVSASRDRTLKVWDLETGGVLRTLEGHSDSVSGVAVTPDGKRAASASDDKTLKFWDLDTGIALATFYCDARVNCCAFAGGQTIVAGDYSGRLHFLHLEEPTSNSSP
jgi:WD40 repeat protein